MWSAVLSSIWEYFWTGVITWKQIVFTGWYAGWKIYIQNNVNIVNNYIVLIRTGTPLYIPDVLTVRSTWVLSVLWRRKRRGKWADMMQLSINRNKVLIGSVATSIPWNQPAISLQKIADQLLLYPQVHVRNNGGECEYEKHKCQKILLLLKMLGIKRKLKRMISAITIRRVSTVNMSIPNRVRSKCNMEIKDLEFVRRGRLCIFPSQNVCGFNL